MKVTENAAKCVGTIPDSAGYRFYPCGRKATSSDGKYCGIHDPERIAARVAARGPSAFEREQARRKEHEAAIDKAAYARGLEDAAKAVMALLPCEGHDFAPDKCETCAWFGHAAAAIRALGEGQ